jgi:hypothetical protein
MDSVLASWRARMIWIGLGDAMAIGSSRDPEARGRLASVC